MSSKIERRIGLLLAVFLLLFCAAIGRSIYVVSAKGAKLRSAASAQQVSKTAVPALRGSIVDRNGVQLAISEPAYDVSATPYLIDRPVAVAGKIAPLLGSTESEILKKIADRESGFAYLKRQLPATKARALIRLQIEGIDLTPTSLRTYPRTWLASQLLGTVGIDRQGLSGVEYSYDKALHGRDGRRRTVRDALGRPLELKDAEPMRPGGTVRLTVDAAIQGRVERVLQGVGTKFRPRGATALVMNPQTGELLALANWPRVDANDTGGAPGYARQNRAIGSTYEPGSTFKAITVAGALEDGKVTPETSFDLPPTIQIADREIGESHPRGAVTLDTAGILAQSSNVGAIKIGLTEGKDRFAWWVERFGFGQPTGISLPGEERGIVPKAEEYSGSSMGNLPIGQGLSVTPMQMAAAYAAIANGGILRTPKIVSSVGDGPVQTDRGKRIISESTAASMRKMLEGVLAEGGTASEAAIPGYRLAGKTGTANKVDPTTGTYSESKYVASFVGFAPVDKPKLLVAVMVDEPKGQIYGGEVAAPAFQQIVGFALPYLRISPR